MSDYNIYPAVDDNFNFPHEVRQAIATSPETRAMYTTPSTVNILIDTAVAPKLDRDEAVVTYTTPAQIGPMLTDALADSQLVLDAAAAAALDAVTNDIAGRDLVEGTDPRIAKPDPDSPGVTFRSPDGSMSDLAVGGDGRFLPHVITHLAEALGMGSPAALFVGPSEPVVGPGQEFIWVETDGAGQVLSTYSGIGV